MSLYALILSTSVPHEFKAEVKAEWPWYFNMKALIGQRPNLVPVGIGHAYDDVDTDAILGNTEPSALSEVDDTSFLERDISRGTRQTHEIYDDSLMIGL